MVTIPAPVPSPTGAAARLARTLADLPGRSADPLVCPFLRLETDDGMAPPGAAMDTGHRCVARATPYVPSPLQQQLVCLRAGHTACPRYTRASAALATSVARDGSRAGLPSSLMLAALAVVAIFAGALAFGVLRGTTGTPAPTPTQLALASVTPTPAPSVTPTPTPSPTPTPTFPPSPSPTPGPSRPAATPAPSGGGGSIANPWAGLPKCPSGQACYLYTVQRGDTFIGIAFEFGTTKAGLQALNPKITNPALIHKGQVIKVPPPPG